MAAKVIYCVMDAGGVYDPTVAPHLVLVWKCDFSTPI